MRGVIISEGFAGLQAQALGLAARAGLEAPTVPLSAGRPWRWFPAAAWPDPIGAVGGLPELPDGLVVSVGGMGAAVGAALRRRQNRQVVQIQNPRMPLKRFDLVVANRHDEIEGPNVLLSRTALHGIGPAVLAAARARWMPRFEHLPRPLVSVLVGGANGRFRLGETEGRALAGSLRAMMRDQKVGLAVTPSRRTAPAVRAILTEALAPERAMVWDMTGENPYLGMLACADAIVVTADSISMVSEAAATDVPVFHVPLPGRSRRIGLFLGALVDAGRIRPFNGRLDRWPVTVLDDTPQVAREMCARLGLPMPVEGVAAAAGVGGR
ncbi:mitochondrial fission ELM1 family protein [Rhizosaccharibacter radicis]|uniref:Mitochondrial fission ELM1 family protein n=1 Tax=Rhizosaccharibacter radicis TaxID=2782605 RepID=A0ABT1VYM3_9PROT|nr:mitochondrial fission ELM1 family protein [Acetobacteraceae bacterium KSS12]